MNTKILLATILIFISTYSVSINAGINTGAGGSVGFVCQNDGTDNLCTCFDYLDCKKLLKSGKCQGTMKPVDDEYDNYYCEWDKRTGPAGNNRFGKVQTPASAGVLRSKESIPNHDIHTGDHAKTALQRPSTVSAKRPETKTNGLIPPKNAKCMKRNDRSYQCSWGGKKYDCDKKKKNCISTTSKSGELNQIVNPQKKSK